MVFKKHVLIIGSGPNALKATELETAFDAIVVINNAWQIRPDWTHLVFPFDFPQEKWPKEIKFSQRKNLYRFKTNMAGLFMLEQPWHLQQGIGLWEL